MTPTMNRATTPAPTADEQARGQQPAEAADRRAGGERAELPAHHAAEDAAEDRHADEQEDRDRLEVEAAAARVAARAALARGVGAGRPSPAIRSPSRSTAVFRPPAKSPARNAGTICSLDDAAGGDVGDRALQRLGHLDLHRRGRSSRPPGAGRRRRPCGRPSTARRRAARTRRCPRARSSARSGSRSARRARSRSPPACSRAHRPAPASASPVWSMTRPVSGGTGSTSCAARQAGGDAEQDAQRRRSASPDRMRRRRRRSARRRGGLVEVDARRHRDLRFVLRP